MAVDGLRGWPYKPLHRTRGRRRKACWTGSDKISKLAGLLICSLAYGLGLGIFDGYFVRLFFDN